MSLTKLRIAFVTGTLQLGGSTTFLVNLAGEFVRRGVSCRVLCGDSLNHFVDDFEQLDIPVSLQDHKRSIFEDRLTGVLGQLQHYKPNVVIATLGPFAFETLRYAPHGVRRVGMIQSNDPLVYEVVEKYADSIDDIVGVSPAIVRKLEMMQAFRGIRKHCLTYGVPMFVKEPRPLRPEEPLRILYLGRLVDEQKRILLLPDIAVGLQEMQVSFHWTIAGDGPDRAVLEEKIKSAKLTSCVEIIGSVKYEEIGRLLDAHDVFILVSDYEGLPLSLLEAMGHGLVPVVSDLESGIRDVVDERCGIRVSPDEVAGYTRAISYLDKHRDELAAKSGAARERVRKEFSAEAMADRWLSVFGVYSPPVEWPRKFKVHGVLIDPQRWKYIAPIRAFRRFLKRIAPSSNGV